jgi:uncharacterized SAM-binding protein YcdF (DUF218 family)
LILALLNIARAANIRQGGILLAIISVVLVLGGMWLARLPILRGIAVLWIVSDEIEPADAIVVLGGGLDVRPFAAASLYERGFAALILVSNPKESSAEVQDAVPADSELNREVLLKLGVPASSIMLFGSGLSNTYEETRALVAWAKSTGAKSVIIPTDFFATRRLRWILGREFDGSGIRVSVQAVSPRRYSVNDWWLHEEGLITFRNEVLKYLYYRFKY